MTTVKKIYEGLKKHDGSITELAKRGNCSREWVRRVLNGTHEDSELMLKAAKLWSELEHKEKARLESVGRFANEAEALSLSNMQLA